MEALIGTLIIILVGWGITYDVKADDTVVEKGEDNE